MIFDMIAKIIRLLDFRCELILLELAVGQNFDIFRTGQDVNRLAVIKGTPPIPPELDTSSVTHKIDPITCAILGDLSLQAYGPSQKLSDEWCRWRLVNFARSTHLFEPAVLHHRATA